MNVTTKVWVTPDNGALVRSETDIAGPTAPDGKVRRQHLSLRYDYTTSRRRRVRTDASSRKVADFSDEMMR